LTVYHGQVSIPKFKAAKAKMYLKSLNNFCVKEISNAHAAAILYHSMLDIGGANQNGEQENQGEAEAAKEWNQLEYFKSNH